MLPRKIVGLGVAAVLGCALAASNAVAQDDAGNAAPAPYGYMGPGMMGGYGYGPGMMGGYGYGMGPGMMYGYGYGSGPGPGMMGGYGIGPGMMYGYGSGPGPDMMGRGWRGQQSNLNLSVDNVKNYFQRWLGYNGNPHVKLGRVVKKDADTVAVDIVTTDKEALVQRFEVDTRTGIVRGGG